MFKILKNYKLILYFFLILTLLFLPLLFPSSFAMTLFCKMGVLIIFSVAYNMLLGQTGLLSFGHAIYFGLAGYASIHFLAGINNTSLPQIPLFLLPFPFVFTTVLKVNSLLLLLLVALPLLLVLVLSLLCLLLLL